MVDADRGGPEFQTTPREAGGGSRHRRKGKNLESSRVRRISLEKKNYEEVDRSPSCSPEGKKEREKKKPPTQSSSLRADPEKRKPLPLPDLRKRDRPTRGHWDREGQEKQKEAARMGDLERTRRGIRPLKES